MLVEEEVGEVGGRARGEVWSCVGVSGVVGSSTPDGTTAVAPLR